MLEVYSLDITVTADSTIPLNNVTIEKGCTAKLSAPSTIELNKCGVYMVAVDGIAEAPTTVTMYKNGVAQPQAQSSSTAIGFTTLVQVPTNNSDCCCSSPTTIQFYNDTATTLTSFNVCVTKVC